MNNEPAPDLELVELCYRQRVYACICASERPGCVRLWSGPSIYRDDMLGQAPAVQARDAAVVCLEPGKAFYRVAHWNPESGSWVMEHGGPRGSGIC